MPDAPAIDPIIPSPDPGDPSPEPGPPVSPAEGEPDELRRALADRDAYARLYRARTVFLRTAVDQDSAPRLVAELMALADDGDDPIRLVINSPGGDVFSLFGIYDTIKQLRVPVDTTCVGMAASAAAVVLAAGTGRRSATRHSRIMIHQPHGGIPRVHTVDLARTAKLFRENRETIEQLLADDTGQSIERIRADTDRDTWFTAEEAVAYGLVDEIA